MSAQPTVKVQLADKPDDVFDAELSAEMLRRTSKLNDTSIDLALRVRQAREFISWSAHHLRGSWLEWMEESSKAVRDVTQDRMAFDRESKTIVAAGKDVVAFFNSPEYIASHERIKEMVATLDRFSELKANGTLDAFADFILKVSCK